MSVAASERLSGEVDVLVVVSVEVVVTGRAEQGPRGRQRTRQHSAAVCVGRRLPERHWKWTQRSAQRHFCFTELSEQTGGCKGTSHGKKSRSNLHKCYYKVYL